MTRAAKNEQVNGDKFLKLYGTQLPSGLQYHMEARKCIVFLNTLN